MRDLQQIVIDRLNQLRDEIVDNIESKGITASGRTQRSIVVEPYRGGVRLVARATDRAPIPTLEIGRPPGNIPGGTRITKAGIVDVSNTFKSILMQWGRDKGIPLTWGGATMLGRRIMQRGTLRHEQHEDVYSTAVNQAAADIANRLMMEIVNQIKSNF